MVVAGAGACGLWFVRKAAAAGLDVLVAERGRVGDGASGGFLGALMPHMPERWNAKKQFQLDGLLSLPNEIAALQEATGISCGYSRVGRLVPLVRHDLRKLAQERRSDASLNWRSPTESFGWQVLERPPLGGWPDDAVAAHGVVFETLAARMDPRRLLAALKRDLGQRRNVRLIEGNGVAAIDAATGTCRLDDGGSVACANVVVAAGAGSFPVVAALTGRPVAEVGRAVKGQAALLGCDMPPDTPLVYCDGVYVVPHADGTVAVGSTSEDVFASPCATDERLDDLLLRARRLCPVLAGAPVIERWAGVRPRAAGREPLVGPVTEGSRIVALTGGFRITLGIAHRMADAALDAIDGGRRVDLPAEFRAAERLARPHPEA